MESIDLSYLEFGSIFLLVAFAGLVDSIAGGGGLITVPTYLAFGLPPGLVLGTNKAVSSTGSLLAVIRYVAHGAVDWRLARPAIILALIGAAFGAWLSRYQSREMMTGLLFVIVPTVLLISLRQPRTRDAEWTQRRHLPSMAGAMGFVLGGYDGFFGPGTGSFLIFGFVYLLGLAAREASGTARIVNFASNIGALGVFVAQLQVHVPVAIVAAAGSLLGNFVGSHLVLHRANTVVRPVFFTVLGLLLAKLVWDRIAGAS